MQTGIVCRLAPLCVYGTSEIVPEDISDGKCTHSVPHEQISICGSSIFGCGWAAEMRYTAHYVCIPWRTSRKSSS